MEVADLYAKLGLRIDARAFTAGDRLIKNVKQGLVALGVYQGAKFLTGLIHETVEAGGHLYELAQSVGVAVEPLQQLGFAGEQSGVSLEMMAQSLGKLSKNAIEAGKGNADLKKAFKSAGLSVADLRSMKPDEMIEKMSNRFQKMPDGPRKTALAMEIFGRAGKQMIPLLNEGEAGIRKMREQFLATGQQISGKDAKALDEFGDNINLMKKELKGLSTQVVVGLLPHLSELLERLRAWVDENRELIKTKLKQVIDILISGVTKLGEAIGYLTEHQWVFKVFIAGFVALKAAAIASAAATLIAWAPVIALILSAVAAIEVISNYNHNKGTTTAAANDYRETAREGPTSWLHAPSDWLAGQAAQLDESVGARSGNGLSFDRDGANATTTAGQVSRYQALLKRQAEARRLPPGQQSRSGDTTITNNITLKPSPGMDEVKLSRLVVEKVVEHSDGEKRAAAAATGQ